MVEGAAVVAGKVEKPEPGDGTTVLLSGELVELVPGLLLEGLTEVLWLEDMPLVVDALDVSLGGVVFGLDEDEVGVSLVLLVIV